jgi:hypothetical protein
MNYERADNLVYLDSKHQKFLVQRQNEVHKAHHKINQLSKLNSSLDTTETESSVLNLASPCVFRSFVVTPICIFELVPLSLSTIFKSLTKYIHSFNTIDFYSNIIPSEVPTFKMTSLPSSPYTSPSEISMAHFQCLALLSSVEYSESEHEVNLLGVELVGTYSDAMEVMRCRGRENQHHWKTNLYGESFVNCPKKSDSGILFPISNQVSIVPSIIVPKNENSTDLITSATRYFENLSPFFQYLIFKRAFLFRKHNYNLSFSLFDQYKFNLAFYHFLLSSVDCFFALSLFPSLLLSSPFLLQHTFFYYCGRDVDRSNYKLQWEEYLKKSKVSHFLNIFFF